MTFLAHGGRKRKNAKQDEDKVETRVREVLETSVKEVQHWFVAETVRRDTMRKYMRMSAKPFKNTRAHFLSDARIRPGA